MYIKAKNRSRIPEFQKFYKNGGCDHFGDSNFIKIGENLAKFHFRDNSQVCIGCQCTSKGIGHRRPMVYDLW